MTFSIIIPIIAVAAGVLVIFLAMRLATKGTIGIREYAPSISATPFMQGTPQSTPFREQPPVEVKPQYELNILKKSILTENEKDFFYKLQRALPTHHIFPQVSFSAILKPANASKKAYFSNLGRFNQKTADYVVCESDTLNVLAVIELDDKTHDAAKDDKRDQILNSAGYRTLRFQSRSKPSEVEIAKLFS